MKNKKRLIIIAILSFIVLLIVFFVFFSKNMAKNLKIGNTISSQEMITDILNLKSYETEIEVEIKSNKNTNKYRIKQTYQGEEKNEQEVLEPSNIAGVKIKRQGNTLTIENTKLNLSKLVENYEYISENQLDLISFVKDYQENEKANYEETDDVIIMRTTCKEQTGIEKSLYLDKQTGNPTKMEVQDTNKKIAVYILYKEVKIK